MGEVEEFLEAFRRVEGGRTALDPEVVAPVVPRRQEDRLDELTSREREVLALMAKG